MKQKKHPQYFSSEPLDGLLNINHINPCHFLQQILPSVACPAFYESVTLDSLDKPQMADALTPLKKMAGNKPK